MTSPALIVALIAAVAGPLLGYIAATRKLSGKIGTSEASSLWQESASIRSDYRDRLAASEARMANLEARIAEEEKANNSLTRENMALASKNAECQRIIEELQHRVDKLEEENQRLHERTSGD